MLEAWHFVGAALRNGSPIPGDGEELVHEGELVLCASGLHASVRAIDALRYAPGGTLCRVVVDGDVLYADDKLCASRRTIVWRIDASSMLRDFARRCAHSCLHLWNYPQVVADYLSSGDDGLRSTAQAAADAAWSTAQAAAQAAAQATAWSAADAADAAWSAAWDAAWESQSGWLEDMATAVHDGTYEKWTPSTGGNSE